MPGDDFGPQASVRRCTGIWWSEVHWHPWERRRPRRQGCPGCIRVRPPTPEPLPTGATGYSSQWRVLGGPGRRRSQGGIRGTRRHQRRHCSTSREKWAVGACSSRFGSTDRPRRTPEISQSGDPHGPRAGMPASNASLHRFPKMTGRDWRVPVRSVRLTDRAGDRKFARAGSVMVRGHPCPHQKRHCRTSRK